MTWIWLILASLLSCAGQLCQKQATRPAKAGRRGAHIALWLGLALLALGSGMLVWLVVLMVQIGKHGLIPENNRRLMCLSMFWHFLDVVWIGVFTFVYLMGVL